MDFRLERDTLGKVKIACTALWGAQTQRSLENFRIGNDKIPMELIYSYAIVKKAAAITNQELNVLEADKADLIIKVCDEILNHEHDSAFPLSVWQTGSGTQTNMNLNEVISNRAQLLLGKTLEDSERFLSANDDVNKSQSSNDTFPTAMHISAFTILKEKTIPHLGALKDSFQNKSNDFSSIVKIGRTHYMDATPITLGQVFSGYVAQLDFGIKALENSLEHLSILAIGGTAVGTGLNTPKKYSTTVVKKISELTKIDFKPSQNKFEGIAAHDAIVESHHALKQLAISLMKIANDIRMLGSGPRAGLGELNLPANEPGSSIMPGKVNPTQCEAMTMVCAQIIGNDSAITVGGMSGQFELNAFKPLMIFNFLNSARILADTTKSFKENCIDGIEANRDQIDSQLKNSLMLVTALNPHIGYKNSAKIANEAFKNKTTLKEEALKSGLVSEKDFDTWVDPTKMV